MTNIILLLAAVSIGYILGRLKGPLPPRHEIRAAKLRARGH